MAILNSYKQIDPKTITVRPDRQRREVKTDDLEDSIRQRGILSPLLVERDGGEIFLIFGERRLRTALKLGLPLVPVRFSEDLPEIDRKIIELEENVKRRNLPWRDEVRAIGMLHDLYLTEQGPEWTQARTAAGLAMSPQDISQTLRVYRDLENPLIAAATGISSAYNALSRRDERRTQDALSELLEGTTETLERPEPRVTPPPAAAEELELPLPAPGAPKAPAQPAPPPPRPTIIPAEESILNESFLDWAPRYSGPKFNFIHCDFPYGINFNSGAGGLGGQYEERDGVSALEVARAMTYDDSPEIYWDLCKCLCETRDRIMAYSSHLMFWLSLDTDTYLATVEFFRQNAPDLVFGRSPLIWHKTDNRGVLADPKRGPRHIYEGALFASREDRLIVKATADTYGAPSDKTHHHSTKPEPMLKYFFGMFVDSGTRLLDPTCGGGSALRAAEALGAASVLGLEKDPEHCAAARSALRSFRALRKLT